MAARWRCEVPAALWVAMTIQVLLLEPSCGGMFQLTKDGRPTAVVVPPRGDTELEDIALAGFTHYVDKASGAELQVAPGSTPRDTRLVTLQTIPERPPMAALPRHGFSYTVTPQHLTITGADPRGLANGVHWLLRQELGERIAEIIRESASRSGPAAFARHPSVAETQMALARVKADVERHRKEMAEAR